MSLEVLAPLMRQNEEALRRLFVEAKTVAALGHGNTVDIFGFGITEDGRAFMVMEHLVGQPLPPSQLDTGEAVPVLLSLAPFQGRFQGPGAWLVEELRSRYGEVEALERTQAATPPPELAAGLERFAEHMGAPQPLFVLHDLRSSWLRGPGRGRLYTPRSRLRTGLFLGLSLVLLMALSLQKRNGSQDEKCGGQFQEQVSLIPIEGVQSAAGLVVADMDGDGTQDIVVASGGDTQPGRILIHYGKPGLSDWRSDDMDFNTRVVAGDLNKDGLLDLSVALFAPPNGQPLPKGAAKVYLSSNGELPRTPTLIIPPADKGLYSPEVALGDANGDGYLDLAVSTLLSAQNEQTPQFIYYNKGGTLDTSSPWISETKVQANAVRFFDIDDDGLMDLLITAPTRTWGWVFKGYRKQDGSAGIATTTTPFELSSGYYKALYTADFDVSPPRPGGNAHLFASHSNHYCATEGCAGFVAMYDARGAMQWRSLETGMASAVRNGALNADGIDDAVAGFWLGNPQCSQPEKCPMPGPLYAYCSSGNDTILPGERLAGDETFMVERMVLVDLDGNATVPRTYEVPEVLSSNGKRFVVTLPERGVMGILSVQRNGQPVPANHYSFVPGTNWVAFAEPLEPHENVVISYAWASVVDIVIADDFRKDVISVIYHR